MCGINGVDYQDDLTHEIQTPKLRRKCPQYKVHSKHTHAHAHLLCQIAMSIVVTNYLTKTEQHNVTVSPTQH